MFTKVYAFMVALSGTVGIINVFPGGERVGNVCTRNLRPLFLTIKGAPYLKNIISLLDSGSVSWTVLKDRREVLI